MPFACLMEMLLKNFSATSEQRFQCVGGFYSDEISQVLRDLPTKIDTMQLGNSANVHNLTT